MLSLDDTCAQEFNFVRVQGPLLLLFQFDALEQGFVMVWMTVVRASRVVSCCAFGLVFTVMLASALWLISTSWKFINIRRAVRWRSMQVASAVQITSAELGCANIRFAAARQVISALATCWFSMPHVQGVLRSFVTRLLAVTMMAMDVFVTMLRTIRHSMCLHNVSVSTFLSIQLQRRNIPIASSCYLLVFSLFSSYFLLYLFVQIHISNIKLILNLLNLHLLLMYWILQLVLQLCLIYQIHLFNGWLGYFIQFLHFQFQELPQLCWFIDITMSLALFLNVNISLFGIVIFRFESLLVP